MFQPLPKRFVHSTEVLNPYLELSAPNLLSRPYRRAEQKTTFPSLTFHPVSVWVLYGFSVWVLYGRFVWVLYGFLVKFLLETNGLTIPVPAKALGKFLSPPQLDMPNWHFKLSTSSLPQRGLKEAQRFLSHKKKNRRIFASRRATERRGGRDVSIIPYLPVADKGTFDTDVLRSQIVTSSCCPFQTWGL